MALVTADLPSRLGGYHLTRPFFLGDSEPPVNFRQSYLQRQINRVMHSEFFHFSDHDTKKILADTQKLKTQLLPPEQSTDQSYDEWKTIALSSFRRLLNEAYPSNQAAEGEDTPLQAAIGRLIYNGVIIDTLAQHSDELSEQTRENLHETLDWVPQILDSATEHLTEGGNLDIDNHPLTPNARYYKKIVDNASHFLAQGDVESINLIQRELVESININLVTLAGLAVVAGAACYLPKTDETELLALPISLFVVGTYVFTLAKAGIRVLDYIDLKKRIGKTRPHNK